MRFALVVFLIAESALAMGSLGGRVTSGPTPLAGVVVSASTASMPKPFVTKTVANGAYSLQGLPAGTYDVTFSLTGYQTLTRRSIVRSFERARVDATLEVSEEGEAVTQTAMSRDVHERPQAVWTLDRETAEALPITRSISGRGFLAPRVRDLTMRIDDIATDAGFFLPPDAIEDTTAMFAGASADEERERADVTTRGRQDLEVSLRVSATRVYGETSQRQEASVGGLWMFAAAERNDQYRAGFAKGTFAPTSHDTATFSYLATTHHLPEEPRGTWLHIAPSASILAQAARHFTSLRGYTFAGGAHELSAGVERRLDDKAWYLRDRWSPSNRFVVEGGLRVDDGKLQPRAGFVFGETTRLIATYARYTNDVGGSEFNETAIGIARRVLSSGYARAMVIRRDHDTIGTIDASAQWLLFTFGGSATLQPHQSMANGWIVIRPPLPGHDLSIALLERYFISRAYTDVAVNYAWPRERVTPFAKAEVLNVLDRDDGRAFRVGVGLRL